MSDLKPAIYMAQQKVIQSPQATAGAFMKSSAKISDIEVVENSLDFGVASKRGLRRIIVLWRTI